MFRNGGMLVSMQNNLNEMLEMLEMLEIESKRIEMVQDVRLIWVVLGFDSEKLMLLSACPLQTLSPTLISKGTCPLCSFARWPSPRWRRCWSKALGTSLGSMPRTMHRLGSPIPRPAAAD